MLKKGKICVIMCFEGMILMYTNRIKRPLNAGLIITAVLSFLLIIYKSLYFLKPILSSVYYVGRGTTAITSMLSVISWVGYISFFLIFGLYILIGYTKDKKGLWYTAMILFSASHLFWAFSQLVDGLRFGLDIWYLRYVAFDLFAAVTAFVIMMVMKPQRKIVPIILSALLVVLTAFSDLLPCLVYGYGINLRALVQLFIYMVEYSPLLLFSISAFGSSAVYAAPPVYAPPMYTPQPQYQYPYAQPQYTQPQPMYTNPVVNPIAPEMTVEQVSAQLEDLKKKFEAGEISEETYNSIREQLLKKI